MFDHIGFPVRDAAKSGAHLAVASAPRADVEAFYDVAIAAGGWDYGGPGLGPRFHGNYYGALALELNGPNIEAVCHAAESA